MVECERLKALQGSQIQQKKLNQSGGGGTDSDADSIQNRMAEEEELDPELKNQAAPSDFDTKSKGSKQNRSNKKPQFNSKD